MNGAQARMPGQPIAGIVRTGVRSIEPLTFAMMICVLVVASLFASFLPALRASRVDPMSALREE